MVADLERAATPEENVTGYQAHPNHTKILLVGGDSGRVRSVQVPAYEALGFQVEHWDWERHESAPKGIQAVVVMTDIVSHDVFHRAQRAADEAGAPCILTTRKMSHAIQEMERRGIVVPHEEEKESITMSSVRPAVSNLPDMPCKVPVTPEAIQKARATFSNANPIAEALLDEIGMWTIHLEANLPYSLTAQAVMALKPLQSVESFVGRIARSVPEGWVLHSETVERAWQLIQGRASGQETAWIFNLIKAIQPDVLYFSTSMGTMRIRPPTQRAILSSAGVLEKLSKEKLLKIRAFLAAAGRATPRVLDSDLQPFFDGWRGKPADFMVGMVRVMLLTDRKPENPMAFYKAYHTLYGKGVEIRYASEAARLLDADYLIALLENQPPRIEAPTRPEVAEPVPPAPPQVEPAPSLPPPSQMTASALLEPTVQPNLMAQLAMLADDLVHVQEDIASLRADPTVQTLASDVKTLGSTLGKLKTNVDDIFGAHLETRISANERRTDPTARLDALDRRIGGIKANLDKTAQEFSDKVNGVQAFCSGLKNSIDTQQREFKDLSDRLGHAIAADDGDLLARVRAVVVDAIEKGMTETKIDERLARLETRTDGMADALKTLIDPDGPSAGTSDLNARFNIINEVMTRSYTDLETRAFRAIEDLESKIGEVKVKSENRITHVEDVLGRILARVEAVERQVDVMESSAQRSQAVSASFQMDNPMSVTVPEHVLRDVLLGLVKSGALTFRVG
jgi:hypothetical protein